MLGVACQDTFSPRQGRVKVGAKAALPPDLRKASGFPATSPSFLRSAGRLSLPAERRGPVLGISATERQSLSARQAAEPLRRVTLRGL